MASETAGIKARIYKLDPTVQNKEIEKAFFGYSVFLNTTEDGVMFIEEEGLFPSFMDDDIPYLADKFRLYVVGEHWDDEFLGHGESWKYEYIPEDLNTGEEMNLESIQNRLSNKE